MRDELLIRRASDRKDKIGSIFLPDEVNEVNQIADVVSVGPGEQVEEGEQRLGLTLKAGDRVLLAYRWEKLLSEDRIGLDGLATIREIDVLCIERDGAWELLFNQIAVVADAPEEKRGSLYIPDHLVREKPKFTAVPGTVVAVGPGHRMKDGSINPLDVNTGDRILFSLFAGEKHKLKLTNGFDGECQLIPEEHCAAILG